MCEVTSWQAALVALWAVVEFWLGRTDKLDAGSTLELILNILKQILAIVLPLLKVGSVFPLSNKKNDKRGK